ncbi:NERD domain-containing protein [Colwellia sp. MB02u-6]|uniref:nuclease-related domain-containing DEAD/DEAH box helicase n=1 Tax=Colwellia sp. MB02u-6 TaxID=2759824 RepID=UPI0015F77417|nr:NERD domain-containing protein [Colwellia sp. MB02u-6]MBA6328136.1 NERD domain-containing protein [Colwellia sp. MB02u-6]
MANIIPKLNESQILNIESFAEQKVYRAIEVALPNEWLVIHSCEYIRENQKHKSHSDREADFVIFSPELGILVIEVKGGGIEYNKRVNQWYSIDRNRVKHEIKNPIKQAKDSKYEISRHLKSQLGNTNPLLAHAALFPDILNTKLLASVEMPSEILGGGDDLKEIRSWIVSVFNYWKGSNDLYDTLGSNGVKTAEKVFGKNISINPSLKLAIEQDSEVQIKLTDQQKNILRQLKRRKTAIIEGGAGTGKTVLALEHAINLSNQGLSVLLLCYNKNLGNNLKYKSISHDAVHAMSFHEFCSWRIRQVKSSTGRDLTAESKMTYSHGNLYDVLMPDALINSYDICPIEYDVVIIDEGQDFRDEFWLSIELLLDRKYQPNFYIFHDSNQSIYTSIDSLPINDEPLYLLDNCRNTASIHNLAYKYYQGVEIEPPRLEGSNNNWIDSDDSNKTQSEKISSLVNELILSEKISPRNITILTIGDFSYARELLEDSKFNKFFKYKSLNRDDLVLVETAKRFKGLESKIIILWILNEEDTSDSLLYVSISRARLRLWVSCSKAMKNRLGI